MPSLIMRSAFAGSEARENILPFGMHNDMEMFVLGNALITDVLGLEHAKNTNLRSQTHTQRERQIKIYEVR